jgi:glycosyltransferase involved in cell wall biosynthesis
LVDLRVAISSLPAEYALNSSLSLLLPVHNSQGTLQRDVQRVVEILPDLTGRFEVLIIDDGSTDATCEVAYELARDYPQILVSRNARSSGWAATVAAKAAHARGDFLMIHCGGDLKPDDVVGLWRLRKGIAEAAAMRRSTKSGKLWRFDRKAPAGNATGGLGIHARAPGSNLLLVHREQTADLKQSLVSMPNTGWPAAIQPANKPGGRSVKRPSFLSRATKFALDE